LMMENKMKTSLDVLNYISGCIYAVVWIPQLYKLFKYRSLKDLSLATLTLYIISSGLYIAWGAINQIMVAYITGAISLFFALFVSIVKIIIDIAIPLYRKEPMSEIIKSIF
jgi:MtN3 and saliva related transmembrane protein